MTAEPDAPTETEDVLPEVTFDEQRYPARPRKLRPAAKRRQNPLHAISAPPFTPDGRNKAYVEWLVEQSMLGDARTLARQLAGLHTMWANPFAAPDPRAATRTRSSWPLRPPRWTGRPTSSSARRRGRSPVSLGR